MHVNIGPYDEERVIDIKIDNYDTWNADHTLALIIYPLLQKMADDKPGAPGTDDEDVPEHLRRENAKPKENYWDTDEFWYDRWDWILEEMTWTFKELSECTWESLYYENGFDKEGYDKHSDKINNGLRLFGKYYRSLWT